jgi:hypothetical protein
MLNDGQEMLGQGHGASPALAGALPQESWTNRLNV